MHKQSGLTMLEVIAILVIIGILAAIVYPTYTSTIRETRRSEAHSAILNTESLVERYLAENNQSNFTSTDLALAEFARYDATSGTPAITKNGYYRITIVPGVSTYTINATATVDGALTDCATSGNEDLLQCPDTTCRIISLNNGAKESTNSSGTVANASTTTCW